MIEIHLYGKFRRLANAASTLGEAVVMMPAQEGDTIEAVVGRLGIDPAELSHLFVNAEYSGIRRGVKSGDRLGIFPREMGLLYKQYFPKIE
jgi:hypothetical protein